MGMRVPMTERRILYAKAKMESLLKGKRPFPW